ncbi:hypothetical protein BDF19DRAFT_433759 [Syncephalis fuscata]|nr:hypothetical protein BDF19DRAFT_433759 [Syncephalis fuscata]
MLAKATVAVAALSALVAVANASPPSKYIGDNTFRIVNADNGYCLNTRGNGDPWFDNCDYNDPLAFERLWSLEKVGGYYLIRNVISKRCIQEGDKAVRMPECNANNPKQLWRFHHDNNNKKYRAGEYKVISKQSDLNNNGRWTCLESDSHISYKTHTINMKCDVNNRRQFFLQARNPGLPRT